MLKEVLYFLNPRPSQNFIDCTFGGGGHSLAILKLIKPDGKVIGIDWDPNIIQNQNVYDNNLILINDNYRNLQDIVKRVSKQYGISHIDGILFDLGLSSDQLAAEDRGFGFSKGELDLRFNISSNSPKAHELLEYLSEKEIKDILIKYGEEPFAGAIAKKIVEKRNKGQPIKTASDLAELVTAIYRRRFTKPSKRHPATRVFQALRIAVNDEYGNINFVLPKAIDLLSIGARLAVITFHSGEDRIVKNIFKELALNDTARIKIITKKPITPSVEEIAKNPRARSAKLRVVEKI